MSSYGQTEQSDIGRGMIAMGDGPAVVDPLAPADPVAALRVELAALEQQLRDLQARYAAKQAQLAAIEAEAV